MPRAVHHPPLTYPGKRAPSTTNLSPPPGRRPPCNPQARVSFIGGQPSRINSTPSPLHAFPPPPRHLWASLPPPELVRAVYPLLSSYADPDTPAYPRHSLSRAALGGPAGEAAGPGGAPPIFLLDAYILILVRA